MNVTLGIGSDRKLNDTQPKWSQTMIKMRHTQAHTDDMYVQHTHK